MSGHRKISPTEQIEMKLWRKKAAKGGRKREREREREREGEIRGR